MFNYKPDFFPWVGLFLLLGFDLWLVISPALLLFDQKRDN